MLHFAAQKGEFETIKLLLKHGANPNLKDYWGITPPVLADERDNAIKIILKRKQEEIKLKKRAIS